MTSILVMFAIASLKVFYGYAFEQPPALGKHKFCVA